MSYMKKVVLINLLLVVVYTFVMKGSNDYMNLVLAFIVAAHTFMQFVISMVSFLMHKNPLANAFLLSSGLTLLVGFSACVAIK